jgi:hypothetical protein
MKSNIFKSEPKNDRFTMEDARPIAREDVNRGRRREENYGINTFGRIGEKANLKPKEMSINIADFPALSTKDQEHKDKNQDYDYASALNKTIVEEEQTFFAEKVPPGWVRITQNKEHKIICEYGETTYKGIEERSLNDEMNDAIEMMKENWRRYKENYIELYGEDAYDKYCIPYNEYDSDSDEEYLDYY